MELTTESRDAISGAARPPQKQLDLTPAELARAVLSAPPSFISQKTLPLRGRNAEALPLPNNPG
jgi:hypothetical protein